MAAVDASRLREGSRVCGNIVHRVVELPKTDSVFIELEHVSTGARHIHIQNNDIENTFSVAFKTVPEDSTGVAHILEHTALCGSKKFPVRDPFFSMLKRSLSTFMNAFTASDWTMYPFSTQNRKDFFNLMAVYLDAVFFPILDPINFRQEGHRVELQEDIKEGDTGRLVYKGIVYNEMKGAMSSPDQVMSRALHETLYPSTTYRFNSGGDPKNIPQLTYSELKAFHQRHYHPSNAFFYTYGNIPLEEILDYLQTAALKDFGRIDPKTDVPAQPRWREPVEKKYYYPFSKKEDPSKKYQVSVAWLTADIKDSFQVLVLTILEQVLLGNAGSPLRKALIDSNLGTALSDGTGLISDNRDTLFSCGLKDVNETSAEKIENIIIDTLTRLVKDGIDTDLIESAIHQIEFQRKEITNHPYPYGIKLLLSFAGSWFHGADPIKILKFESDIETLRRKIGNTTFFEEHIKRYFLNNPHRVRLTLAPDQDMEDKENRRVTAKLKEIWKQLNPSDIKRLKQEANSLRQLQESEEDLVSLPTLERDDIPPSVQVVEENVSYKHIPAVFYQQPTSGIVYFTGAIGTGPLNDQLVPLVPFFSYALSRIGTEFCDYTKLVKRIDAYTGGVGFSVHARTGFGENGQCIPFIAFNGKCLNRNQVSMFDILEEILFHFNPSDKTRLRHLLMEYRAGMESMIIHSGHRFAMSLASRNFSSAANLSETWHGIYQLKSIKELTDDLTEEKLAAVSQAFDSIGDILIKRDNIKMAVIGEKQALNEAISPLTAIENRLNGGISNVFNPPEMTVENSRIWEGWSTASAVSFVARTFRTVRMDHEDSPALYVISKLLRSLYLHREIREKGGAYGGFSVYNPEDGIFSFASYRDPHILNTLNVFDGAVRFIRSGDFADEDVKEAILQTCSELDKPDSPGVAARKAFFRKILSLNDGARIRFKQGILSLTRREVRSVVDKYFNAAHKDYSVAVISSDEKLMTANQKMTDHPLSLHRI